MVQTWGSAPRGIGSKMAVTQDMALAGSVSGGCVEGAVVESALESLEDGRPRMLTFGVSDDEAWEVGLTCGGKISVFVEPLDAAWWAQLTPRLQQHRSATSLTLLDGEFAGSKALIGRMAASSTARRTCRPAVAQTLADAAGVRSTHSGRVEHAGQALLVDRHLPGPQLILVGGVHVAMPLQAFARELGFRVALIDPRKVFATRERFPDVEQILHSLPGRCAAAAGTG